MQEQNIKEQNLVKQHLRRDPTLVYAHNKISMEIKMKIRNGPLFGYEVRKDEL